MAVALLRHYYPGLYVQSAGILPGARDPFVDTVLAEVGLDLGDHRPHGLADLEDLNFDLAITLSPEAHHAALELTRTQAIGVEYWASADPTLTEGSRERILDAYRAVRDSLSGRIRARFSA
jgi:protein-tyrosine-phosphatase